LKWDKPPESSHRHSAPPVLYRSPIPRVQATLEAVEKHLTINGFVYRSHPSDTLEQNDLLLGEFKGAFLPCTFWLATSFVKTGRLDKAEARLGLPRQTLEFKSGIWESTSVVSQVDPPNPFIASGLASIRLDLQGMYAYPSQKVQNSNSKVAIGKSKNGSRDRLDTHLHRGRRSSWHDAWTVVGPRRS
jgi:hypothetical protein